MRAAALAVLLALAGCARVDVDGQLYACEDDAECGPGYCCGAPAEDGVRWCVPADRVCGIPEPDARDGGGDAERDDLNELGEDAHDTSETEAGPDADAGPDGEDTEMDGADVFVLDCADPPLTGAIEIAGETDFGAVLVGDRYGSRRALTLTNTGAETAWCLSAGLAPEGTPFRFVGGAAPGLAGTCGEALEAGAWCTLDVTMQPTLEDALGPAEAELVVEWGGGPASVTLSGVVARVAGVAAGPGDHACAWLEPSVDDGAVRCWGQGDNLELGRTVSDAGAQLPGPLDHPELLGTGQVSQVAVGLGSSCALADGAAWCWGARDAGALVSGGQARAGAFGGLLGDGLTQGSAADPVPVAAPEGVSALGLGAAHACLLTQGGEAWCWGAHDLGSALGAPAAWGGLLGHGAEVPGAGSPVKVSGVEDAVALSVGTGHSCVARASGAVACWGANATGQQGDLTTEASATPTEAFGLTGAYAVAAAAPAGISTGGATCALFGQGSTRCWGSDALQLLGNGPAGDEPTPLSGGPTGLAKAEHLAAGQGHVCAGLTGGAVACWGDNAGGALGRGTLDLEAGATPEEVPDLTLAEGAHALSAGRNRTCAVSAEGAVCWGDGTRGACGDGSEAPRPSPGGVVGLPSRGLALAAGDFHTCAAMTTGRVSCWGRADSGQVGPKAGELTDLPVRVPLPWPALDVAAGARHSCALSETGAVVCWGASDKGQLGSSGAQEEVALGAPALDVACGGDTCCALLRGGAVSCWGDNSSGQLGRAKNEAALPFDPSPAPVQGLAGARAVAVGASHACAAVAGEAVRCWGQGTEGQVGPGGANAQIVPLAVAGVVDATQVACGQAHSCALTEDALWCWGDDSWGQLLLKEGAGPIEVPASLLPIAGPIAAGGWHTCVVGGCFGANTTEPAGGTTGGGQALPMSDDPPVALAAGLLHSCAVRAAGQIECWGVNDAGGDPDLGFGQLGGGRIGGSRALAPDGPARRIAGGY